MLAVAAAWAQFWSSTPPQLESGVVVYIAEYDRDVPRGPAPGEHWYVAHVVGDAAIGWTGEPVWVTYAPEPLEYATEPYAAVWWIGPADWNLDGTVTIADLLCYLDEWFTESGDAAMLADFVGRWFE